MNDLSKGAAEFMGQIEELLQRYPHLETLRTGLKRIEEAERELRRSADLLSLIRDAQSTFIAGADPRKVFEELLRILVKVTESDYGFLDEVLTDEDGRIFKKSLALTDISWDEDSRKLYDQLAASRFEFRNLRNLAAAPAVTGRLVIANDPSSDPRSGGLPRGHPPLMSYMGIPMYFGGELVGVVGVANRRGGYTEETASFLEPFISTCAGIIQALRTERRERQYTEALRKSEEKFRTMIDFTYDWEYWVAPERTFIYVSPSCEQVSGYRPEDFYKDAGLLDRIVHPEDRAFFAEHVSLYHLGENFDREMGETEFRIITKSGDERWIGHVCRPVFNAAGGFLGRRISNRDITHRKAAEKEIIASRDKINELNENILNMLMLMSHDIRSPLIATAAALKLLLRGVYGKMDASVHNTVKDVAHRVQQILGIAEDSLGRASAVEGALKMERSVYDLRLDVIDRVLDELVVEIQENDIGIDNRMGAIPAGTIRVHASKIWVKAVYRNLFKNAIKYGGKGCTIAFGYEDHGAHYRLNVYNSGKTIPEEDRRHLFTKFGRIPQEGQGTKDGVGLGLYLIKEIIQQHGGDIWYEAKAEGSDFVFTLPKA